MSLEHKNVSDYFEPLAWKDKNSLNDDDYGVKDDVKCSITVDSDFKAVDTRCNFFLALARSREVILRVGLRIVLHPLWTRSE